MKIESFIFCFFQLRSPSSTVTTQTDIKQRNSSKTGQGGLDIEMYGLRQSDISRILIGFDLYMDVG